MFGINFLARLDFFSRAQVNPGDWVSTSKDYARMEGRTTTSSDDDYPVVKFQARAEHLRNEGNSLDEWLDGAELQKATRDLVAPLVYRYGKYLFFADLSGIESSLPLMVQPDGPAPPLQIYLQDLAH